VQGLLGVHDTVPFRTLAVTTALWQGACCVGLGFDTPLAVTFGLVLLLQAGQTVAGPTWQALVPSIADEEEIGRVVSTSQARRPWPVSQWRWSDTARHC
jgi:hypothetical protein